MHVFSVPLLFSFSGHKQAVVSSCWYPTARGLLGEVCHEQPAFWQTHEPQTSARITGQYKLQLDDIF